MSINLTYKSQETVLNQGLANVLNSSVLKDTVLACSDGKCLKAHRLILSTFSPYFKQLLSACKEPMPTILLPDVKVSVMKVLLEFMYTGNVRVKKEMVSQLVEANKCLSISGLSDLLSRHNESYQPPNKKQRTEAGFQAFEKPFSLFRPWDSPVVAPRPEYFNPMPWIPSMYGSSMLPYPIAHGMNISNATSIYNTNGVAPNVPSPFSWTMPLAYPFSGDLAATKFMTESLLHHNDVPLSATTPLFQNTVSIPNADREQQLTPPGLESVNKIAQHKGSIKRNRAKQEGKYLVPGKERCDICKRDFFNVLGHKKAAHGLLKKPIRCCGKEFTTRQDLREHKKIECDFRKSW